MKSLIKTLTVSIYHENYLKLTYDQVILKHLKPKPKPQTPSELKRLKTLELILRKYLTNIYLFWELAFPTSTLVNISGLNNFN